jgi:hypothetical protein
MTSKLPNKAQQNSFIYRFLKIATKIGFLNAITGIMLTTIQSTIRIMTVSVDQRKMLLTTIVLECIWAVMFAADCAGFCGGIWEKMKLA